MKIGLLYNVETNNQQYWINSLRKAKADFKVIDLESSKWLKEITEGKFDLIIAIPNGSFSLKKQIFDERIYFVNKVLGIPIYPSLNELLVYENKRVLSQYLQYYDLPHPETHVFFDFTEAKNFLSNCSFPIVAKSNIGAAGSGVYVIKDKKSALTLTRKALIGKGYPRKFGPNLNKPHLAKRIRSKIFDINFVKNKIKRYLEIHSDRENSIIFQEYIPNHEEWRVFRIGETYISHRKVPRGGLGSGSGVRDFSNPDFGLLDFVKQASEKLKFDTVAFDIFVLENGTYLICEIQTYFGLPHYMKVNGEVGRYVWKSNRWIFEKGVFDTNFTCDIRLEHALSVFRDGKKLDNKK